MHLITYILFLLQKWRYGKVLETSRIYAKSPWIYLGISTLYGALDRRGSPVDPKLRSLITTLVSKLNECAFCVSLNTSVAVKRGEVEEKISQVEHFKDSPLFTKSEKAALDFAQALTYFKVTDTLRQELKKYFTEEQIVEIATLAAYQNMTTRFNRAF